MSELSLKNMLLSGLSVLFFNIVPLTGYGQESYTLEQCRDMALANNKKSEIAVKTVEKYKYISKSYFANYFPKISATGIYGYSTGSFNYGIAGGMLPTFMPVIGNDGTLTHAPNILISGGLPVTDADGNMVFKEYAYFPDMNLNFETRNIFYGGVTLEQPVYMGGKITAAYRLADIGREIAQINIKLTRSEVIVKTDEAFWTLVKVKELLLTAEKYREVVHELYRTVNNAYEGGMASMNDLLKVKVKVNEAELKLRKAQNGVKLAAMNLCHIVGLPLTMDISVIGSFEEETEPVYMGDDVTLCPEYEILSKQIELKRNERLLAKSDFMPNIGALASYGYMNGLFLNDERLMDNASFMALVSVKIPVFHWGEGINKIRASGVELEIAEMQREDAVGMMTLKVTQEYNKYYESFLEVRMNREALDQAEENLRISKDHYEAGLETLAEYMEAQTLWQQSRSNYIESQSALMLFKTEYLKAAGLLNEEAGNE